MCQLYAGLAGGPKVRPEEPCFLQIACQSCNLTGFRGSLLFAGPSKYDGALDGSNSLRGSCPALTRHACLYRNFYPALRVFSCKEVPSCFIRRCCPFTSLAESPEFYPDPQPWPFAKADRVTLWPAKSLSLPC